MAIAASKRHLEEELEYVETDSVYSQLPPAVTRMAEFRAGSLRLSLRSVIQLMRNISGSAQPTTTQ